MAWGWLRRGRRQQTATEIALAERIDDMTALTAASWTRNAQALVASQRGLVTSYSSWQRELWDYYETCGEYNLAVTWRSNMISRVRLRAAEIHADLDEPQIVDSGPAAEIVNELFGDIGGQADALAALSTYLDVPGEGWIVDENGQLRTYSSDEIRAYGKPNTYEVIADDSLPSQQRWRPLDPNSLITRVWRPHRRMRHEAFSPAKSARQAIRELDLVNRHIQAQYLSRLASAGIVVLPEELTFPTRPEFDDAADPFVAEWIATAKQAIETPGTAAAVVPIPMRVPAEFVEKVQHIDFTLKIDDKIIEKRDAARRRLAGIINIPTELLFEAGSINHWGLWQLEESGVKTYLTPDVELIVNAVTRGQLRPRLLARGEDPDVVRRSVVWYDLSEIVSRPNNVDNVTKAYDRLEVSGRALRRAIGLDEDSAPTRQELEDQALRHLASQPQTAFTALRELTGLEVQVPTGVGSPAASGAPPANPGPVPGPSNEQSPAGGPPDTGNEPPLMPRSAMSSLVSLELDPERVAFATLQANSQHIIEFTGKTYVLKHPLLCAPKLFSCPFAHVVHEGIPVHPGTSGDYECLLNAAGNLVIGRRVYPSADALLSDPPRGVNGVRVPR